MKDNKASMGFSHLEVWFTKKYQGVSQKECKRLLREEHDNSLLYEELEEHFGQLSNEEKVYGKNIFIQEFLTLMMLLCLMVFWKTTFRLNLIRRIWLLRIMWHLSRMVIRLRNL